MGKLLISLIMCSLILQSSALTLSSAKNQVVDHRDHRSRAKKPIEHRTMKVPRTTSRVKRIPLASMPTGSPEFIDRTDNMTTLPQKVTGKKKKETVVILADQLDLGDHTYSWKNQTSPRNLIILANEIRVTGKTIFDMSGNTRMVSVKRSKNFTLPKHRRGEYLDWCLTWGANCGQPTALAFCKSQNFKEVESFKQKKDYGKRGKTMRTFGDNKVCKKPFCDAFEFIKCKTQSPKRPSNLTKARGGTIAILADRLICGDGKLELLAQGFKYRGKNIAPGGRIFLAYEEAPNGDKCVKGVVGGSKPGKFQRETSLKKYLEYDKQNGALVLAHWRNTLLGTITTHIIDANVGPDYGALVTLFEKFETIVKDKSKYPIIPQAEKDSWTKQVENLTKKRNELIPPLYSKPYSFNDPMPRTALGFSESSNSKIRLAPTDVLVQPRHLEGRDTLGMLQFNPDNPNQVVLHFDAELRVDPLLEQRIREKIVAEHQEYGGMFTNWTLKAKVLPLAGMVDEHVEMVAGNKLNVTLTLSTHTLAVVLLKLTSPGGIPIELEYAYREKPEIAGQITGLSLSLARQNTTPVKVKSDSLVNDYNKPVIVDYLQSGANFHLFHSPLILPPGETKVSTIPPKGSWKVPAEAISYERLDPTHVHEYFATVNDDQFLDRIVIKNLLKFDERRGGAFESVEITVQYFNEEKSEEVGVELTSSKGKGSEETFSFMHRPENKRKIIISGTAFFEGESTQTIKPVEFTSNVIRITDELLPPIAN